MASRLSEDPNISVLVLEAGSDQFDDPKLRALNGVVELPQANLTLFPVLPAQYGHHIGQPEYDWATKTVWVQMYIDICFTNCESRLHKTSLMGGNMPWPGENRDAFLIMFLTRWNRGKVLGGSSAINLLCWTKPPAEEVDGETAPSSFQSK